MGDVITVLSGFPTVLFTVPLAVSLLYWLFVVLGAFDLHHGHADGVGDGALDGALEGAAKGAAEGIAEGAAHAATDGIADGALDGSIEGAAKGAAEGVGKGMANEVFTGLSNTLHLRDAPITVFLTLFTAFGFLVSALAMQTLGPLWAGWGMPHGLLGAAVLLVATLASLGLSSVAVRPLAPLFATHKAKGRGDLVGRVCVISTGHVDARFGQATLEDGGAGLILQVRCETEGVLARGDRALILGWDPKSEGFVVEPMDDVLPRIAAPSSDKAEEEAEEEASGNRATSRVS